MVAALRGGSEASADVGAGGLGGASPAVDALSPRHRAMGRLQDVSQRERETIKSVLKMPFRFQRARWPVVGQVGWRGGLAAIDVMAGVKRTVAVETGSREQDILGK